MRRAHVCQRKGCMKRSEVLTWVLAWSECFIQLCSPIAKQSTASSAWLNDTERKYINEQGQYCTISILKAIADGLLLSWQVWMPVHYKDACLLLILSLLGFHERSARHWTANMCPYYLLCESLLCANKRTVIYCCASIICTFHQNLVALSYGQLGLIN